MKDVISVKGLNKEFKLKLRSEGFVNFFKELFKPRYKLVEAVKDVSFNIKQGELVAFIGPNGAGKSTTIKMMSGILYPTTGNISVLDMNPNKDRKKLAYEIGTVFGQKPQLWYHLPAIDTFNLFCKIYDLDNAVYEKRLKKLVDLFEIGEFIDQPVRKLSLGQRMRCEMVASLLHNPKVLFLDEPTIGLDVIAKKKFRELILKLNREEKLTIVLTSHDMDDIEKICKKLIIINDGAIVYDGSISDIKRKYLKYKILNVLANEPIGDYKAKYSTILKKSEFGMKLEIDTSNVKIKDVLNNLGSQFDIEDITITDPPIEEIIHRIYDGKE